VRAELARRDGRRRFRETRARVEVREEEIRGRGCLHAACALHGFVFGEELQRHRLIAAGEPVEKDHELPARAIDDRLDGVDIGPRFLEPRKLPLDLVGVRDHRVHSHHLDRARGLVHVRAARA
jgi:hypothetical protein